MRGNTSDELRKMVAQLGPGMWLELDDEAMTRFFGTNENALTAAKAFADEERCVFICDQDGKFRFGRYYFKRRRRPD
jgi:hypothetical protein